MKEYRISISIECFDDDTPHVICGGSRFVIGKKKLLEQLEKQYIIYKKWLENNLEESNNESYKL